MEFCPECGAMMLPNNGILKCNKCGYSNELDDNKEYSISEDAISNENVKIIGTDKIKPIITDTSIYHPRRFNKITK